MSLLKKIIKSLVNIAILAMLFFFIATWFSLSPEQRAHWVKKLDEHTPYISLDDLSHKLNLDVVNNLFNTGYDDSSTYDADSPYTSINRGNETHILETNCLLPEKKEKQHTNKQKIFQWRDKNGKLHFSDTALNPNAQDVSHQYKTRKQFISTEILLQDASLPLDSHTKINTSISKIFTILSESLEVKQLHQLELTLKVFGEQNSFQNYLRQKAPRLKQAVGFYLPQENEASVLLQSTPEQSLSLIRHEASHVIMANLYGLTPLWLNEGFAEYFQQLKIAGFEASIYPNQAAVNRLKTLSKQPGYSIQKHFSLSPLDWQGQNISQHYAEAWSIVYFLLSEPKGRQVLARFLQELSLSPCQLPDNQAFFQEHYPGGLTSFEKDWTHWLMQKQIQPHRH